MERTLQILLAHNAWATRKLLDGCAALSPEQFHQPFEMGPGSVHNTLLHIIGAMQRWSDRIGGRDLRPSPESAGRKWSIVELRDLLERVERDLDSAARAVCDAGAMSATMEVSFDGQVLRFSKAAALVHVTTHGMHHRAQALNMLRRLGHSGLVDELDALDWALAHEGA